MKICFFADGSSIHTVKWCNAFVNMGHTVSVISFSPVCNIENIDFYPIKTNGINIRGGNWKVLLKFPVVKKILKVIKPDVFHAHYATSYGITGALAGFHPYAITAHGSDVLISPKKSKLYRLLLAYAFKKTDWINLVSDHMRAAVNDLSDFNQKIDVIPFGINTNQFNVASRKIEQGKFVITSTRSFEPVYNIPHLIKAVALLYKNYQNIQLNLIGDGSQRSVLVKLVEELGISNVTIFHGSVDQNEIVKVLSKSQVYTSVSLSDGNSISLVEALACGCIPVVTDIVANHQWVKNSETGFLVEVNDIDGLAAAFETVFENYKELDLKMTPVNQRNISNKADLKVNLSKIEAKYKQLINKKT